MIVFDDNDEARRVFVFFFFSAFDLRREGCVRPAESAGQDPRGGRGALDSNGRGRMRSLICGQ
jgi:hypothetical protein